MKRVILLILLWMPFSLAQDALSPEQIADESVKEWLGQESINPMSLASLPPEEICEQLPSLLGNAAPPKDTKVNLENRVEQASEEAGVKIFNYPASLPRDQLEVVEVRLIQQADVWEVERVGFQLADVSVGVPGFFQQPLAAWLYITMSLLLLYLLIRPSFFRRWLAQGWAVVQQHRGIVIGAIVSMYGLFMLGALLGAGLPPTCKTGVEAFLSSTLEELGATDAYGSGNIARAAVVTTYQNFVMGALATTFFPTLLSFGILGYVINGARFFLIGIPFGFGLQGGLFGFVLVFILLIVELMAYIMVTAGGGIFLMTIIRKGLSSLREAYRALLLMLPIAFLLLVIGAWYEATVIILPALLGGF